MIIEIVSCAIGIPLDTALIMAGRIVGQVFSCSWPRVGVELSQVSLVLNRLVHCFCIAESQLTLPGTP